MAELLKAGEHVTLDSSAMPCLVEQLLGGGTQGEVYRARLGGEAVALKWYYPHYLDNDVGLRERLETAMLRGAPSDRFLWPMEFASSSRVDGYGYVMPLREPQYKSIMDLIRRRVEPSFRALATAGFALADSYLQLHAKGLCYRDINFENVFFDPDGGDVRVCDNDNVDVNGVPGAILGTPRFMAPEIVRGEALPSTQTDLYSLAVLLFYMFVMHHPLEGRREAVCEVLDADVMQKLYGSEPLFIFDPDDDRNAPVPGYQDTPLAFWGVYPRFLRTLFTRAFTNGLRDPACGRVLEGEWRAVMVRLRDSIVYCSACQVENFYDIEAMRAGGGPTACWACSAPVATPPRIRVGNTVVMLNHDTQLFPHHVDMGRRYDFSRPVAAVTRHPTDPTRWGLQNLMTDRWVTKFPDGRLREIDAGHSVALALGTRIDFGRGAEGEIRL